MLLQIAKESKNIVDYFACQLLGPRANIQLYGVIIYQNMLLHCLILFYLVHSVVSQIIACPKQCSGCLNNATICSACSSGYQLNTQGQCVQGNHRNCAVYSVNLATCIVCQPSFRASNGTCIKDLSGCVEFQGQNCIECSFGKLLVKGSCQGTLNCQKYMNRTCVQCAKGYFLNKNTCFSADSNCQRIDYVSGACIQCSKNSTLNGYSCLNITNSELNCYIFNSNETCMICKRGYIMNKGKCIIIPLCSEGYYLSSNFTCVSLPKGCKQFDVKNQTCRQCHINHQLMNDSCQSSPPQNCQYIDTFGNCLLCKDGYYAISFMCKLLSPYCKTYGSSGKCLSCKISYFINRGGLCWDPFCLNMTEYECLQCKEDFSFSDITGKCTLVDTNCLALTQTSCLQCYQGYYLSNTICKPLPSQCKSANKYGACNQCQINNYLQFDRCFAVNPVEPYCRVYSPITSQSKCIVCELGYFQSLGKCFQIPQYCTLILSNGNCVSCRSRYRLVSNQCQPQKGISQDNCLFKNKQNCLKCRAGFTLGMNGICYPFNNANCIQYDSFGKCVACSNGSMISRDACILTTLVDINCKRYNKNECIQCYQGYYLIRNRCRMPNSNCSTFNRSNGGCTKCYPGFVLTNSQCVVKSLIQNCLSYDGFGKCLQCSYMYYISNNRCNKVNGVCQNYNPFTGACTSCFPGYRLKNYTCIKEDSPLWSTETSLTVACKIKKGSVCLECPFRYYIRDNICLIVSSSCNSYNSIGNCLTCNIGYFLKGSSCLSYNSLNGSDQNCKTFKDQSYCLQCYNGFINIEGECKSVNPLCKTHDSSTGSCTSCYQGYLLDKFSCTLSGFQAINPCLQRSIDGYCLRCTKGYQITNGQCQYNITNEVKNSNVPFCQIATAINHCSLCQPGFYVREGYCYEVSSFCQGYNPQNGKCQSCKIGYIFDNGACLSPALGFDEKCKTYTGAFCSLCVPGYYLKNYICEIIDRKCLNFNLDINQCLQCSQGTPLFDTCQ